MFLIILFLSLNGFGVNRLDYFVSEVADVKSKDAEVALAIKLW